MAYRYDEDLEFLSKLNSKDLDDLVFTLTHDKDGSERLTEELTTNHMYKSYYPEHIKYWKEIAGEVQCFGANTFVTMLRGGKGVLYKEILIEVCEKLKVNFNKNSTIETIENNLLMKILTDAIEKMSSDELKELALATGVKNIDKPTKEIMIGVFQAVFRAGGFKSYQLTLIIVNAVLKALIGRGLSFAGNATLMRTMAILSGPIGWVITGLWTAIDIAGAAYRVTIPAVINIAALRQKYLYQKTADNLEFN